MKTYDFSLLLLNGKNLTFYLFPLLVLFFQNLVIFWNLYFNNVGFQADFSTAYYALPAFWTTAISEGIIPQWIPFQSMGYPLFMNAQSGFYYPFLWIFPILNIPYTLDAAVIFQVLHVFFGSVGMFFFLKFMFNSRKYALVGAIAFQFFGGFYALSSYPDIIRALAISPWLFYVFTINLEKPTLSRRILFIPIVLFVLVTGAYPGNYISSIFMMGLFVSLQSINGFVRGIGKRKSLVIVIVLFGLILLGIAISSVHLGPFLQFGNELTRFSDEPELKFSNLLPHQFVMMFIPSEEIIGPHFGNSFFITLPMLVFASFLPLSSIKKYWIFFVMLFVAVLMAIGQNSFFWNAMTSIFPILELSRFPVSDYRIFIVIPLVIFAIAGLKAIIEKKFTMETFVLRTTFILSWFSVGIFSLYYSTIIIAQESMLLFFIRSNFLSLQIISSGLILTPTVCLIGYYIVKSHKNDLIFFKKSISLSIIVLILFSTIILVDGSRVVFYLIDWKMIPSDYFYIKHDLLLEKDDKLITYSIFDNLPEERPHRKLTKAHASAGAFTWAGYVNGTYLMRDEGATIFNARIDVLQSRPYRQFMFIEWTPLLLDPPNNAESLKISLPESTFLNLKNLPKETAVVQTFYGINDISYQVSLDEPRLMVENEMYFPGWKADLIYPEKTISIQSLVVNDIFRAWILPAGEYEMKASFQFPNLMLYQTISLGSFLTWIAICIVFWKKLHFSKIHPIINKKS